MIPEILQPKKVHATQQLLKLTYGLLFLVVGADKFFNIIVHWGKYVNPSILHLLHLDYSSFRILLAVIEIGLGLLVLTRHTRAGAYAIALWFLIIAIDLVSIGYFDIAARDVGLAIGAISLAWLTEAQGQ